MRAFLAACAVIVILAGLTALALNGILQRSSAVAFATTGARVTVYP